MVNQNKFFLLIKRQTKNVFPRDVGRTEVRSLRKKRSQRVIYHQDNAPSRTTADTILDNEHLDFELLKKVWKHA